MTIHGKITFKEAIIIDEKLMEDLEKVVLEYFTNIKYVGGLCNGDDIVFDTLSELLLYENANQRKLIKLKVKFDYNEIEFYPTIGGMCSYKYTVCGFFTTNNENISILFEKKIKDILEKHRRKKWYTILTKISMMHFSIFLPGISAVSTIYTIMQGELLGEVVYTINLVNLGMLSVMLFIVLCIIFAKCRNALLPPVCFMLGEQIQEIKRNEDRFSKIFWGVVVAFIVSFIVAKIA
ncbi:MAG: hypothetical protein NC312_09180 [Bacteroides fragilis]|nr:hypothetical protein [Bacteroides fragilis]